MMLLWKAALLRILKECRSDPSVLGTKRRYMRIRTFNVNQPGERN